MNKKRQNFIAVVVIVFLLAVVLNPGEKKNSTFSSISDTLSYCNEEYQDARDVADDNDHKRPEGCWQISETTAKCWGYYRERYMQGPMETALATIGKYWFYDPTENSDYDNYLLYLCQKGTLSFTTSGAENDFCQADSDCSSGLLCDNRSSWLSNSYTCRVAGREYPFSCPKPSDDIVPEDYTQRQQLLCRDANYQCCLSTNYEWNDDSPELNLINKYDFPTVKDNGKVGNNFTLRYVCDGGERSYSGNILWDVPSSGVYYSLTSSPGSASCSGRTCPGTTYLGESGSLIINELLLYKLNLQNSPILYLNLNCVGSRSWDRSSEGSLQFPHTVTIPAAKIENCNTNDDCIGKKFVADTFKTERLICNCDSDQWVPYANLENCRNHNTGSHCESSYCYYYSSPPSFCSGSTSRSSSNTRGYIYKDIQVVDVPEHLENTTKDPNIECISNRCTCVSNIWKEQQNPATVCADEFIQEISNCGETRYTLKGTVTCKPKCNGRFMTADVGCNAGKCQYEPLSSPALSSKCEDLLPPVSRDQLTTSINQWKSRSISRERLGELIDGWALANTVLTPQQSCASTGGIWQDFGTPCDVPKCSATNTKKNSLMCAQVITQGCACPTGTCWDGDKCIEGTS